MRHATKSFLQLLVAGFLVCCTVLPVTAQNTDAIATVDRLHAALLDIMQNAQALGFAGRRDRIAPVVHESMDLPFITRVALGRSWADMSAAERDAMVDLFSRWTVANYAARFDGYSGERFEVVSAKPSRKGRELVRTVLEVGDDSAADVSLDYLLRENDGKWRIINVIANGVSDLSLKRADYGAVIKTQGLDALIAKLNDQIDALASED